MAISIHPHPGAPEGRRFGAPRDPRAFVRIFIGVFVRDLESFFPGCRVEPLDDDPPDDSKPRRSRGGGLDFRLVEAPAEDGRRGAVVSLFGARHRIVPEGPMGLGDEDLRLIRAMGAVLELNYQVLFRRSSTSILHLLRGMPEDHYVAARLEPSAYAPGGSAPSRVAEAVLALRAMALATYENRRVTTGVLILGSDVASTPSPAGALDFGVELTGLKSLGRLCDGKRAVMLVDRAGRLVDVVDVHEWVRRETPATAELEVPCPRSYRAHALATRQGGHVCLVLGRRQEIKVFSGGAQTFGHAHGRWRVHDPASKFAIWRDAVANPRLARVLFQTALELVEERQGGLLVVFPEPSRAIGRVIAPEDALGGGVEPRSETLGRRSIRYLAEGRSVLAMAPSVVEAMASLDGALAVDAEGRLLAFGAILRHDASSPRDVAEGARTTAAIVASRYGPVLKISEDGVVSCFLDGFRVWDL